MIETRGEPRTIEVRMPQLGESVDAGTIVRWLKSVGDPVGPEDPLYEVTSDKATMEVPALAAGYLREIVAAEGATIEVGSVVARIAGEPDRLSPVVRKLLREHGIDAAAIPRSAGTGRITKDDVLAFVAQRGQAAAAGPQGRDASVASVTSPAADVTLPAADLTLPAAYAALPAHRDPSPATAANGVTHRKPFSAIRLRAGERLAAAQKSAVNVFSVIEIDFESVAAERARRKLSYLPFAARAVIDALRAYDVLNAVFDESGTGLVYSDAVHLGIAVDLDEAGLVVPVIRNAQALTVDGLAAEIDRLAAGARALKLAPSDYSGSTFTITNNGAFGMLMTAPVINAPNVAIVSTDAVELRPVIIDRAIAIRHRMYLGMTWDHRAFDGSTAARFMGRIKHNIETWDWTVQ